MAMILVVEDDAATASVLARLLRRRGHDACVAPDGAAALELVRRQAPDLIILDMMMPHMDGMEVLRRLKSDPQTAAAPVILLSAVDDPKLVASALKQGASAYWVKASFRYDELPQRLAAHLP